MSFKLQYLTIRGLAEVTRVLFAIGKQEYDDSRYPIDFTTYEKPEFCAAQTAGDFDVSMGKVPLLTYTGPDGEVKIGQSYTIARFVAKKLGLFGSNELEAAQIDMIVEHVRDIKQKVSDARAGKSGEELAAAMAKFIAEDLPTWLNKLEKTLPGTKGFAVGDKISLADVVIHSLLKDSIGDVSAAGSAAPKVLASAEAVQVAAATWFAERTVTPF